MTEKELTQVALLHTSIVDDMSHYIDDMKNQGYKCHVLKTEKYSEKEKERVIKECQDKNIKNVMAFDMEQLEMMGAVNEAICPFAPKRDVVNLIKNKYIQRSVEANPEMWFKPVYLTEKNEDILKKPVEYPCMLKATAFYLGYYVYKIENEEDLKNKIEELRKMEDFASYCDEMDRIFKEFPENIKPKDYPPLLLEKRFDLTQIGQLSADCYMDENNCVLLNCRDLVYSPNGLKIGIVWPPVEFDKEDARIINNFCTDLGKKLNKMGLRNHAFNYEIFYTKEKKAFLTEVNMLANFNFVHVMELMSQENYLQLCFDVQLNKKIDLSRVPFENFMNGTLKKWCCQTTANIFHPGYTQDYIDFNYIKNLNSKTHRYSTFHGEGEFIPSERIGIAGHYCVDIWFTVDKEEDIWAHDKEIKTAVFKDPTDIDRFIYPTISK